MMYVKNGTDIKISYYLRAVDSIAIVIWQKINYSHATIFWFVWRAL